MHKVEFEAQNYYPRVLVKITSGTGQLVLGVTEFAGAGNYTIPVALIPAQAREIAAELVHHANEVEGGL
jgi:hypothetical protein